MYLERALFVVAPRSHGKSTILRSMLQDRRFGVSREARQSQRKLSDDFALGNDRHLYLRLTSPHEMDEDLDEFINKSRAKMLNGRWCFAGPLHPVNFGKMPDAAMTIERFIQEFSPERVRVMLPWPNFRSADGEEVFGAESVSDLLATLHAIDSRIDAHCIDGRRKGGCGLVLADFFDFN